MEHQKVLNSLNEVSDSKFVTRNWNTVNEQSNANYSAGNEIMQHRSVKIYNYLLIQDDITIIGHNLLTEVAFTNCAAFTKCITKTDGPTIDDAEDLKCCYVDV